MPHIRRIFFLFPALSSFYSSVVVVVAGVVVPVINCSPARFGFPAVQNHSEQAGSRPRSARVLAICAAFARVV